jgi:phosphoglycerate dehydrogenase-like enzyme
MVSGRIVLNGGLSGRQYGREASNQPAPRLRLLQSVAAGLDLLDTAAVPKGVTVCNVFGHEQPIAEYVIMTMLGRAPNEADPA